MEHLKGKRLLILGAAGLIADAVKIAKSLGVITVVTDYYPDAPAKRFADVAYDVSTTDIDALEALARREKIDGVFTGYSDINLFSAKALCDRLGLPFYANDRQLDVTTNKLAFKELCRKHRVPTVEEFSVSAEPTEEELSQIRYPVMVKPADSYASKGCRVCQNEEELIDAVRYALTFSRAGKVIVERYMDPAVCDDVGICYIFSDGVAYPSYIGDRTTNTQQVGRAPLTAAVISPSVFAEEYLQNVDQNTKNMFRDLGISDGRASIQAFHDEDGFYFYEMGFRLTGGRQYFVVREEFGTDEVTSLIEYALTGKMHPENLESLTPKYQNFYCDLVLICSAGTIARIDGLEEVKRDARVLDVAEQSSVGKVILAEGTQNQVLARVCLKETSREKLNDAIRFVTETLVAYDENGKKMMLDSTPRT